jgi:hypothetical protein
MTQEKAEAMAARLVQFLESGEAPAGLFAADVFCDFTMPLWRLQARGLEGLVGLRKQGHPGPGKIPRWRTDATEKGFVIEFDERWEQNGKEWTSREMARADVRGDSISSLSIYCTGDWDEKRRAEHAKAVSLIRP